MSVGRVGWGPAGDWNVYWNVEFLLLMWDRLVPIASIKVLMALQETKLAAHYIENVRAALRRDGYVFHPGRAVAQYRAGGSGDSCRVGFLASPGVAVSQIMPLCAVDVCMLWRGCRPSTSRSQRVSASSPSMHLCSITPTARKSFSRRSWKFWRRWGGSSLCCCLAASTAPLPLLAIIRRVHRKRNGSRFLILSLFSIFFIHQ